MLGRFVTRSICFHAQAGYAATFRQRSFVLGYSKSRQFQYFSTSAKSESNPDPAIKSNSSGSSCGSVQSEAPVIGRGLEQKTIDDLKDMHVEAVDDEDEPFAWKNPKTGYCTLIFLARRLLTACESLSHRGNRRTERISTKC
jgi:hypothetical protein